MYGVISGIKKSLFFRSFAMEYQTIATRRADFEGDLRRFDQRYVVVDMAYRGIESYGIVVVSGHVTDHVIHVLIITVRLVVSKLPDYQTSELRQDAAQPELVHDALDFIDWLGDVLYEEDCIGLDDVVWRIDQFGDDSEISAGQTACGYAAAVVAVAFEGEGWSRTAQDGKQLCIVRVFGPETDACGHR